MEKMQELMQFIDNSVTSYHAVCEVEKKLKNAGFELLSEKKLWELEGGKSYYMIRNDSSLIAFRIPDGGLDKIKGFHIFAAHTDSPAFKIKEDPEMEKEGKYVVLNTEKYGGMILSTWMDRPLTIAGRVCLAEDEGIVSYPVRMADHICMIPNLAIHMNRDMNNGVALNPQVDMLPLLTMKTGEQGSLTIKEMAAGVLSEDLGRKIDAQEILAGDLYVENSEKAVLAGADREFIMAPRYDDLGCVYAGLQGILNSEASHYITMLALFDNEEVGSLTRQGADSTLLRDTLDNIADGLGACAGVLRTWIADSFLLSADNAHACHPNQGGKADPKNRPFLNQGIVLKYHGSQKYATDAYSAAYVKQLCQRCSVPLQTYANRSDIAGGSTLGNLVMAQVSMPAADIGLPQLAMHSAYETAGVTDMEYMIRLAEAFFS